MQKKHFQVAWWAIFYSPLGKGNITIFQSYLAKNLHRWESESGLFQQVLVSWLSINPSFYFVDNSKSGRVFVLCDIFEAQTRIVYMYNDIYRMPKCGEIITGMLLPTGDGCYITPSGFFHIPELQSQIVFQEILPFYEKNLESPNYKFNSLLYPDLLNICARTMENHPLKK